MPNYITKVTKSIDKTKVEGYNNHRTQERGTQMKIWEKIKQFLGMEQKPKQIEAPKTQNAYEGNEYKESLKVEESTLEEAQVLQQKEQQRDFQVMFALKNLCGTGLNLFGVDFATMLQSTLQRYGYTSELQLDQLDLEILARANMNLNLRKSDKLSEYINDSQNPAEATKILMTRAREQAIKTASQWQCTEKEAYRYVPTDVVSEFEQTIEIEKMEQEQENTQ